MANTPNENLMSELASQMISQIGSFFERISASSSRPIASFAGETAQNILYVLYSANGLPLFAGVILASSGKRGEARAQKEVQALAGSGYVASYRTVEFGSENMAMQMERLVTDLFGAALPLSARSSRGGSSDAAPSRGPGRPRREAGSASAATATKRRGRPSKATASEGAAAAPRRRGRPSRSAAIEGAPERRPPGRPRKTESAGATPTRGPGRPRKVATEEATAPRRRGRPRKEGSTGTGRSRGRGGRKGSGAEAGGNEG